METRTLQDMVTAAAAVNSTRIAVTFDSCMDTRIPVSLLYSDVAEFSNDLTHLLREKQVTNRIALYCQTDVYLPVWILGILKVPAAYVPLDPGVPALLSAHIIDQCGLKYCLVQWDLLEQFQMAFSSFMNVDVRAVWSTYNVTLVRLRNTMAQVQHGGGREGTHEEMANADLSAQGSGPGNVSQGELAYVLHTSGTTGLPKIVRVPHKCIVPNILHLSSLFQMTADDVVFLASPLTFDPSVVEMFLALSSGARLLMVPTVMKKKPNRLACALFKNHRTTFLQVTPTLLGRFGRTLLQEVVFSKDSSLRVLALGGEACPSPGLLRSWRQEGNHTQIYNIYGITEVSCWACCYKLSETDPMANQDESSVPLGTPLMDTTVEVRDEHSCVVAEGEGQVFIGGTDRVCLLDDEVEAVPGTMRATGDWVQVKDSCLYFLGRQDRLIKRQGQRVHLDTLQQALMSVPLVEACAVGLSEDSRLVAFMVASSASGDQKEELSTSTRSLRRAIRRSLSRLLPSPSVPDKVVVVPALPLTSHGKVDMGQLMKIYQRQKATPDFRTPSNVVSLRKMLQSMWQDRLGLSEDAVVSDDSNFLFSGGDSLQALGLCDDITAAIGGTLLGLLEIVLDGSFSDILHHAATAMPTLSSERKLKPHSPSEAKKRPTDPLSSAPTKRGRLDDSFTSAAPRRPPAASSAVKATRFTVLRRAGEVIETPKENSATGGTVTWKGDALTVGGTSRQGTFPSDPLAVEHRETCGGERRETGVWALRVRWASDTGRCVDASPVLLVNGRGEDASGGPTTTTVFVGSHSHRMQALDLASGELLWERVLGDRIESSAAVCAREGLVVVGCYDGCVYFLCVNTGDTKWTFQTGDAVKCCPTVDPLTGLVLVGSHDGHMYSLDPQARQCVWKRHCGGGAVFSSPCLHPSLRHLYVATLGGHLLCLRPDSGAVLWTRSRETPFFSSPGCSSGRMVVGSVDGNIYCFSLQGTELWRFTTSGPVFSSPCVTRDEAWVVCGSHDDHVYCLSCADGSLAWSFRASGRVYSSPCVFDGSPWGGASGALVAVASTDGTLWILDMEDGTLVASLSLPGELFSSPVAWERSLVVGCRNNFVYCVEMTDSG
ncbi:beta-alanine-activating enzyme isoform X3 [Hypomesus transpacificus]|uniref:beta-alanine-activating enzyme isoform X3 n=1 Tax=Hypomesus transpacificus TaxID=137520 RepID=UPI001F0769BD|nr:beta-alanine-activating enzyme isoform X3 [Hypomesus transpacificus]